MKKYSLLAGVSALALIVAGCDVAPENVSENNVTVVAEENVIANELANENADDETPVHVDTL